MPITIKELIASDTISQAADKINFNFDQILLNGGGPRGPIGPAGPIGPMGSRGIRGSVWYEDSAVEPVSDPNNLVIPGLNDRDFFLQSNGDVWQWDGSESEWVNTGINLKGPTGEQGLGSGFSYAGGFPNSFMPARENIAFPIPMPNGGDGGASTDSNEGVSSVLLGGVTSNAARFDGGVFTDSFAIPNEIAEKLDSSVMSVLINQKNATSKAIGFIGGGANDNYERTNFNNLSHIKLGTDDRLEIIVPKGPTDQNNILELIGFRVDTQQKGQSYEAGNFIQFISGRSSGPSLNNVSDISFRVGTSNQNNPAKFSIDIDPTENGNNGFGRFRLGRGITLPNNTSAGGSGLMEAEEIKILGKNSYIDLRENSVRLETRVGIGVNNISGPAKLHVNQGHVIITGTSTEARLGVGLNNPQNPIHVSNGGTFDNLISGGIQTPWGEIFSPSIRISTVAETGISTNINSAIPVVGGATTDYLGFIVKNKICGYFEVIGDAPLDGSSQNLTSGFNRRSLNIYGRSRVILNEDNVWGKTPGNVAIGINSNSTGLYQAFGNTNGINIATGSQQRIRIDSNGEWRFYSQDGNTERIRINTNGGVQLSSNTIVDLTEPPQLLTFPYTPNGDITDSDFNGPSALVTAEPHDRIVYMFPDEGIMDFGSFIEDGSVEIIARIRVGVNDLGKQVFRTAITGMTRLMLNQPLQGSFDKSDSVDLAILQSTWKNVNFSILLPANMQLIVDSKRTGLTLKNPGYNEGTLAIIQYKIRTVRLGKEDTIF